VVYVADLQSMWAKTRSMLSKKHCHVQENTMS